MSKKNKCELVTLPVCKAYTGKKDLRDIRADSQNCYRMGNYPHRRGWHSCRYYEYDAKHDEYSGIPCIYCDYGLCISYDALHAALKKEGME